MGQDKTKKCKYLDCCDFSVKDKKKKDIYLMSYKSLNKGIIKRIRKQYCKNKIKMKECARRKIADIIGIENVPFIMLPTEHKFAESVIKANKYKNSDLLKDIFKNYPCAK